MASKVFAVIRAFVGVNLPKDLQEHLTGWSDWVRSLHLDGRTPRPGSIHLTLKFLGEVDRDQIRSIQQALQESTREVAPFDLRVGGLATFPNLRRPRVLWIGVEECQSLSQFKQALETKLEELGFPRDRRSFQPHLTLMRLKSVPTREQLAEFLRSEAQNGRLGVLGVTEVQLYQSVLKPQGAEYHKLVTVKLARPSRQVD